MVDLVPISRSFNNKTMVGLTNSQTQRYKVNVDLVFSLSSISLFSIEMENQ